MPRQRSSIPELRKQLKRDPGVPGRELRATAARMVRTPSPYQGGIAQENAKRVRNAPNQNREDMTANARGSAARLALDAQQRLQEYSTRQQIAAQNQEDTDTSPGTMCLRRFYQDFQHVVDVSDVLLEVLDARDPTACRLRLAEETIRSQHGDSKKIILLLNKMDLVPLDIALQWLEYFRSEGEEVIAFSTQQRGGSFETSDLTRRCIDNVFKVLRDHSRTTQGSHKSITVGVIGYPNVGKSSVINALKRKDVVGVANMPGSTRGPAEVELRQGVKIVDCPGVVFDTAQVRADLVLINAIKLADVADPIGIINRIISKVGMQRLIDHYKIPNSCDVVELLHNVAVRKGRLIAGGVADEEGVARCILKDWNDGQIAFFTKPPEGGSGGARAKHRDPKVLEDTEGHGDTVELHTSFAEGSSMGPSNKDVSYGVSDTVHSSRAKVMKRLRQLL
eukprot:PhF_6_TR41313/c0_g1_i1/m.62571/K14538/NUG1, GNL3; nuclear GTP-binding protein